MAELSLQPGVCVAELTREHGVNDNLVFNWCNLHRQGLLDPANRATLIPVTVEPLFAASRAQRACLSSSAIGYQLQTYLPGGSLSLTGPLMPALLCVLVSELRGEKHDYLSGGRSHLAGCRRDRHVLQL